MQHLTFLNKTGEFSTQLAIGSFAFGTLFLLAFKVAPDETGSFLVLAGLVYVLLAGLVNAMVFIYLFFECLITPSHQRYLAIKMLIMLANIPIVMLYIFLIVN